MCCLENFWKRYVGSCSKKVIYILYTVIMIYGVIYLLLTIVDTYLDPKNRVAMFWTGIVISIVTILNSWLGLYAVASNEKVLISFSNVQLFVTCAIQIIILFQLIVPLKDADGLKKQLTELFAKEDEDDFQKFRKIEISYGCCGVVGHDDYEERFEPILLGYPSVCCGESAGKCLEPSAEGCYQTILGINHRNDLIRATTYLSTFAVKFVTCLCVAILTF